MQKPSKWLSLLVATLAALVFAVPSAAQATNAPVPEPIAGAAPGNPVSPDTQAACGLFDQFFIGTGDVTDSYGHWDSASYNLKTANNTCGLITYVENLRAQNDIVGTDGVKIRARYSNASGQTVTSQPVLVTLVHCCSDRTLYRITGNVPVGHYVRLEILVSTNDGSDPGDGKYCVDTSCDGWLRT